MESFPRLTFKNQPRTIDHATEAKYNERRLGLVPAIENFLANDELFAGREVSVEFSHKGVSSLVSFIETEGEKYVLKIPLAEKPLEGEGTFLKTWEAAGVPVPHVFEEGEIGAHQYLMMSYIDAPVLSEAIKDGKADQSAFIEAGKTLRDMHGPKAEGFGRLKEGAAEFASFADWVLSEDIQKRIKSVKANGILGNEHGPIHDAVDILIAHAEKGTQGAYCHFDFGTDNLLATEPLTVIDPNPILSLPAVDIGRAIQLSGSRSFAAGEFLKEGYFASGDDMGPAVLQAGIVLSSYIKIDNWHKRGRNERIEETREYLKRTRHLLA